MILKKVQMRLLIFQILYFLMIYFLILKRPLPHLLLQQRVTAKSYAVGRKAFLFHTSEAGAGASAVMYSIVETAKANNLNIFQYLYMVLLYMPDYMNSSAGIEQLMPWSEFIKEQCSGIIDVESNVPENRIPLPCR